MEEALRVPASPELSGQEGEDKTAAGKSEMHMDSDPPEDKKTGVLPNGYH